MPPVTTRIRGQVGLLTLPCKSVMSVVGTMMVVTFVVMYVTSVTAVVVCCVASLTGVRVRRARFWSCSRTSAAVMMVGRSIMTVGTSLRVKERHLSVGKLVVAVHMGALLAPVSLLNSPVQVSRTPLLARQFVCRLVLLILSVVVTVWKNLPSGHPVVIVLEQR